MFFELRQYRIKDGRRDEWAKYMEDVIIPYQVSKGMVVVGSFVAVDEDDLYIWIRRFYSEEQRAALYEAVYECDEWQRRSNPCATRCSTARGWSSPASTPRRNR